MWSLGMLIWHILTLSYPIDSITFEDMIKLTKDGITIPELPNSGSYE